MTFQYRLTEVDCDTGEPIRATQWFDFAPVGSVITVDGWEFMELREKPAEPSKPQRQYRWKANNDHGTWTEWLDVPKSGCTSFVAEAVASVEFRDKPEPPKWEVGKWYRGRQTGRVFQARYVYPDGDVAYDARRGEYKRGIATAGSRKNFDEIEAPE